jgi:hypothetical protein
MTAVFLWLLVLFLVQHELVGALASAAFLAFQAWLLVLTVRVRPSSWSSGPPAPDGRRRPSDRP